MKNKYWRKRNFNKNYYNMRKSKRNFEGADNDHSSYSNKSYNSPRSRSERCLLLSRGKA
jgi:hypothetical protein